jgi:hypothetical protein
VVGKKRLRVILMVLVWLIRAAVDDFEATMQEFGC